MELKNNIELAYEKNTNATNKVLIATHKKFSLCLENLNIIIQFSEKEYQYKICRF